MYNYTSQAIFKSRWFVAFFAPHLRKMLQSAYYHYYRTTLNRPKDNPTIPLGSICLQTSSFTTTSQHYFLKMTETGRAGLTEEFLEAVADQGVVSGDSVHHCCQTVDTALDYL